MPERALGVLGKVPRAGAVKTRLSPPLLPEQAAALYAAFLRDSLLLGITLGLGEVWLICPPGSELAALGGQIPAGVRLVAQREAGFGAAMEEALGLLLGLAPRAILIGSDSPSLPAAYVERSFGLLESGSCDVVLGPADDGGYYLIGLRQAQPALFREIDWSSERVLAQTLARAEAAGLRVALLPPWYDVDDHVSLRRLVDDLGRDGELAAPATRAALRRLRAEGAPVPDSPTPWEVVTQRVIDSAGWRDFVVDTVRTHRGEVIEYAYLRSPAAVWVVPVTSEGEVVLVRQYRHPVRSWLLEVPAGSVREERPEDAAVRELREEIGGRTAALRYQGSFYPSSGQLSLQGHAFLALDVTLGEPAHESSELLVPVHVPAEVSFEMARRGEIEGGCALALLMCEPTIRAHLRGR